MKKSLEENKLQRKKYSAPKVKKTKLSLKIWGGAGSCSSGY